MDTFFICAHCVSVSGWFAPPSHLKSHPFSRSTNHLVCRGVSPTWDLKVADPEVVWRQNISSILNFWIAFFQFPTKTRKGQLLILTWENIVSEDTVQDGHTEKCYSDLIYGLGWRQLSLFIHSSIYSPVNPFACLFICLYIYLSVDLSIIHPFFLPSFHPPSFLPLPSSFSSHLSISISPCYKEIFP